MAISTSFDIDHNGDLNIPHSKVILKAPAFPSPDLSVSVFLLPGKLRTKNLQKKMYFAYCYKCDLVNTLADSSNKIVIDITMLSHCMSKSKYPQRNIVAFCH